MPPVLANFHPMLHPLSAGNAVCPLGQNPWDACLNEPLSGGAFVSDIRFAKFSELKTPARGLHFATLAEQGLDARFAPYRHAQLCTVARVIAEKTEAPLRLLGMAPGALLKQKILLLPDWAMAQHKKNHGLAESSPQIVRMEDGTLVCNTDRLLNDDGAIRTEDLRALNVALICNVLEHEPALEGFLPEKYTLDGLLPEASEVRADFASFLYRHWQANAVPARDALSPGEAKQYALFERLMNEQLMNLGGPSRQAMPPLFAVLNGDQPAEGRDLARQTYARFYALTYTASIYADLLQSRIQPYVPKDFDVGDMVGKIVFDYASPNRAVMHTDAKQIHLKDGRIPPRSLDLVVNVRSLLEFSRPIHRVVLHELVHVAENPILQSKMRQVLESLARGQMNADECVAGPLKNRALISELAPEWVVSDILGSAGRIKARGDYEIANRWFAASNLHDRFLKLLVKPQYPDMRDVGAAVTLLIQGCEEAKRNPGHLL